MRISDWSSDVSSSDLLSGGREKPGEARSALQENKGDWIEPEAFAAFCAAEFADAAEKYLTGKQPFVAKLHPQYALHSDSDLLARVSEWLGGARTGDGSRAQELTAERQSGGRGRH